MTGAASDPRNLPAHAYCDPDIHRREQAAIFRRSWQLVCAASLLGAAGAYLATRLGGIAVIVMRGDDGRLRAFRNACPHRGARLVADGCELIENLTCPYHGWRFGTRGDCEEMPWFRQPTPLDPAAYPLDQLALETWRGLVFVAIEPAEPLTAQLGDLPRLIERVDLEAMGTLATSRFSADVNWKAYVDQFTENYHVPIVHAPDKSVAIWNYTVTAGDNTVTLAAPGKGMHFGGRWIWIWPNCTLSTFPGGMKLSRVQPTGPASFEIFYHYLFGDDGDAAARERVIASTEAIFHDDVAACRLVQANYADGNYRPGPLRPDLETGVIYFQSRVREALGDL